MSFKPISVPVKNTILSIEKLRARYGAAEVLHGIDLALAEREVAVVLGANGAGKTTLLRAISGMVERTGQIMFSGRNITYDRGSVVAKSGIAHVPDNRGTFGDLSVDENLRLGAYRFADNRIAAEGAARVKTYFPRLAERATQQAGSLSGGEQQMLAIARALMMRPRLLLLDEPSFGLAPLIVAEIYRILARIRSEEGVSMLIVEQHAEIALSLADRAYVLALGEVKFVGAAREAHANPTVRKSYLGP